MLRGKHHIEKFQSTGLHHPRSKDDEQDIESKEALIPGSIELEDVSTQSHQNADSVNDRNSVDNLTTSLSSLKFVPPSIRFGRGGRRGGFARS